MSIMDVFYQNLKARKENKTLFKKYFIPEIIPLVFEETTPTYGSNFGHVSFTGQSTESVLGVTAPDPEVYTVMAPLFDAIIKDYHKLNPKEEIQHPASYFGDIMSIDCSDLDPDGQIIMASRVQINRCYNDFLFANRLTPEIRAELESKSKEALTSLTGELSGNYYSLDGLSTELKDELEKEHLLFDSSYEVNKANGVYKEWPDNRGVFVNDLKTFVAWVNEEDHLKLISTGKGSDIGTPYRQAKNAVQVLQKKLDFVKNDQRGYLTYCPSNVGTGLHAVFHVKIPHLANNKKFDSICDKLNLTAKVLSKAPKEGEAESVDIIHKVANKRTVGVTEIDVMSEMIASIRELVRLEKDAAEGKDKSSCTLS